MTTLHLVGDSIAIIYDFHDDANVQFQHKLL
jgi:hypothetical protein